jgi:hypothetical protein
VEHMNLIAAGRLKGQIQRVGDVLGPHVCAKFPRDDVPAVIVQDRAEIEPSTTAFLVSEVGDLAVYAPLRKSGFVRAAVISSIVGLVLDSQIFLAIAFGSLEFLAGQVLGKVWMVMIAIPLLVYFKARFQHAEST